MDITLRSLMKCHGYWIAASCGTFVIWWTWFTLDEEQTLGYVKAHNIRYGGIPALIFGFLWILACAALVAGVYKESLFLLCPFASMFLIEFCMMFCRDVYLLSSDHNIDETVLFNLSAPDKAYLPFILFVVPSMAFSLLALMQIFRHSRIDEQDAVLIIITKH